MACPKVMMAVTSDCYKEESRSMRFARRRASHIKRLSLVNVSEEINIHTYERLPTAYACKPREPSSSIYLLQRLIDETGTNTPCTNSCSLYCARLLVYTAQFLKVRIPCSFCLIIGMAYVVTNNGFLPTYFTNSRHIKAPI